MNELIALLDLASQLPSGLNDAEAASKLLRERDELLEALHAEDYVGALTEGADAAYYAAKHLEWVAQQLGVTVPVLFALAQAKYTLRAREGNPKDDPAERAACAAVIGATGSYLSPHLPTDAPAQSPLRPLPLDDGLNQAFVYCQECGWFDTVPAALREDVETWLRFMDPAAPQDLGVYDNLAACPRCSATAVDDDLFVVPRADLEAELAAGELPASTLKRLRRLLAWHTELLKQRGYAPAVPSASVAADTETPLGLAYADGWDTDGGW